MTNEQYAQLVKKRSRNSRLWLDCLKAFLIGGAICTLGQGILELYLSLGLEQETAATLCSVTLIFLGDDVIRTSRDAERMLGAEVIAVIPYSKSESTAFEEKKKKRGRRKTS